MDREQLSAWVAAYERAWRAPGTGSLAEIFTEDATYLQAPYRQPVVGLSAIARMWEADRDGPDEVFRMASEPVAVEGDTGVVRVQVWYGEPVEQEYLDVWIVRFAADGRCQAFEEWPFWPGQPRTASAEGD
jgi:ketosteroid isomerase-like protein